MGDMARPPAPRIRPGHSSASERPSDASVEGSVAVDALERASQPSGPRRLSDPEAGQSQAATPTPEREIVAAKSQSPGRGFGQPESGDEPWLDLTTQELAELAPGGVTEHGSRFAPPTARAPSSSTLSATRAVKPQQTRPVTPVVEASAEPTEWLLPRELLRALRAGLEAMVLSWLIVVVPVVAGYVATVASPVLGESAWVDAARNGTAVWLLGLGQPISVPTMLDGETSVSTVTIVPLCLTLLTFWLLQGAVRRARIGSLPGLAVVVATAGAVVAGAVILTGEPPTTWGLVTTAVVILAGIGLGWWRSGLAPALPRDPLVDAAAAGLRAGVRALAWMLAVGLALVLIAVVGNAAEIWQIHRALDPDAMSAFLMVLAQVAALPTFAVWALAWLVGPGFAIGAVEVTSSAASAGPLPVLPILAAVPEEGPGPGRWVLLIPIAVAALSLLRPLAGQRLWREQAIFAGSAIAVAGVVGGVLGALSGGSLGPLDGVGTSGLALGLALAGATGAGVALAWGAGWVLRLAGFDLAATDGFSIRSLWTGAREHLPRRARPARR